MSVFSGSDIGTVGSAILAAIKRRIDAIPYRRLKDLRSDEVEDFVSDFWIDQIEVDFENPVFRSFEDGEGWVLGYSPMYRDNQIREVLVKGRNFIFEATVTKGSEYVRYSPRGGAEEFDLVFLADKHFESMDLGSNNDDTAFIRFSVFIPEHELQRLSEDQIADRLVTLRKEYLKGTLQRLQHLNLRIDAVNWWLVEETNKMISSKITHDSLTDKISSAVGIQIVPRNGSMVSGKKIEISPKKMMSTPGEVKPYEGYYIDSENYGSILETIRQHLIATENLPKAIQKLADEELIRDTILWALQSTYFIATGESFRQNGKTDISILYRDKSAFVAECKIWRGPSTIQPSLQQLFSYTTWRDSKACILIFNLEVQDFGKVCQQTFEEAQKHPMFKSVIKKREKNDFSLLFKDPSDENSTMEVAFLIANYVKR